MSRSEYTALFAQKVEDQVAGEGSTYYLHLAEHVAPLMAADNPDLKLIFCLRDPVERARSHYNYSFSRMGPYMPNGAGNPMSFSEFIRDEKMFEMGNYADHLPTFFDIFGRDRVLVVFFGDIRENRSKVLSDICEHIGVDPRFEYRKPETTNLTKYPKYHRTIRGFDRIFSLAYPHLPARARNAILLKRRELLFAVDGDKYELTEEERADAYELYRPSVEKLQSMLDRDLSGWLGADRTDRT
ncbi:sulfotransferase domain-containing protein [Qipengyuania atrilutea]|uniref:Sulfotransferase domain-containing protein n=1 Tax=Qipengyuania atrilutea TaxID=2744473 RepID=A0A850H121_9SPHN|nr:sulfotransferase domain-containing protein [Actirhodobacter atriluteus]NVD44220.1 sulfotransferase domain-containing protein [Actirhodobacter atriluteus]